jgi:quercetin dioxygenase-like cupin family protein
MQQAEFEVELKSSGYTQIEIKSLDPRPANSEHAHDYDIRGLVLDGLFTVRQEGRAESYRPGEIFAVPANRKHSEEIGSEGARVIVGRKYEHAT